jgi:spermidine synthase
MELWFTEEHTKNMRFSIKVDRQVYSGKSYYQQIDIFDTPEFGRVLTLDGCLMVSEKDEFIYHDMIVHVPLATNPKIRDVLVIGAGDGGAVRELVRYDSIRHIDMVEIDEVVVMACKKHLPQTACKLEDPRVHIYFEDGLPFVRRQEARYDLIIVDSTDPFGPGEGLFTREFYGNCYKALREDGILVNQMECAFYDNFSESMQSAYQKVSKVFPVCRVYSAPIPTYPSGNWCFGYSSKGTDPVGDLQADWWNGLGLSTRYYNTDLHKAAFALPNYLKEIISI